MGPIRIFISYAHANAIWLEKTVLDQRGNTHRNPRDLLTYWRNGLQLDWDVEFWYDRDENDGLRGGDVWEKRIFEEIDHAEVGVLLITQEFVQSGFIRRKELPRMLARAARGEMDIVPVLVEPAEWEELDLASLQLTPGHPTPLLQSLSEHEQHFKTAMLEVLRSLKTHVRRAHERRKAAPALKGMANRSGNQPILEEADSTSARATRRADLLGMVTDKDRRLGLFVRLHLDYPSWTRLLQDHHLDQLPKLLDDTEGELEMPEDCAKALRAFVAEALAKQ
jgi:hypothetical protein